MNGDSDVWVQGMPIPSYIQNFQIGDIVGWNSPSLEIYAVGKVTSVSGPVDLSQLPAASGWFGYSYVVQTPDGRTFGVADYNLNLIRHEMSQE